MLNPAIHCQTLNEQLRDRNKFVMDAFRLYVQMFSLVAGGAAFIAIRPERPPTSFAGLADVLAVLTRAAGRYCYDVGNGDFAGVILAL